MVEWHHSLNGYEFEQIPGGQGIWCAAVHGVAKSRTRLSHLTFMASFIFLGSKITADGDCSHEIKTLASWKESYDQPR